MPRPVLLRRGSMSILLLLLVKTISIKVSLFHIHRTYSRSPMNMSLIFIVNLLNDDEYHLIHWRTCSQIQIQLM